MNGINGLRKNHFGFTLIRTVNIDLPTFVDTDGDPLQLSKNRFELILAAALCQCFHGLRLSYGDAVRLLLLLQDSF